MSLKKLEVLTDNILNMVIYVQSPSLAYFIKSKLRTRLNVHKDFVVNVDTAKGLQDAKLDSYIAPLLCDKWLIHVDADKLSKKELFTNLEKNTVHGITVYWTTKYMVFKQLTESKEVKTQSVHCPVFSFSRLSYGDIVHLHKEMVPENKRMNAELLDYVCKGYRYDVQAVCDLFTMVKSGSEFTSKREIIENIGVGGNSVASLMVRILTAKPKTDKSKKRILSNTLKLMDDLSITYSHQTIRKFMLSNLDGCIEMKQLQILGIYKRPNKEIPETFNIKRLSMLRRYEKTILHEISLPTLLNLKLCLLKYNSFNAEIALIQAISAFYDNLQAEKK